MERRKAVTAAAAASLTMLAGAAGIALNSGIVGSTNDGKVGQLDPVSTPGTPVTIYVDDTTVPGTVPVVGSAPAVRAAESAPVAASSASSQEDDEYEEDDDHEDDHEDDDHEGADDDD